MTLPARIGKYPITAVLGEGAMGVVYQAQDPVIGRSVAIKTIHKRLLADDTGESFAERFRNEARSAGRLSHPNIVAVHEYGEDDDDAFIVMEFAPGRTLAQQLAATPLPPEAEILRLMDQLLDALACAHRHGVWHRDVKPANLIVTETGQLKVTDFGIARIASAALTQTGSAIGTPGYMAPEQYLGEAIDQRVDVFASGVLLYRMLAGRPPFTGTPEAVMYQLFNETPVAPSRVEGSGRDARFDAVVARAIERDAAARFASADAFRQALAAASAGDADATVVTSPPAPSPAATAPEPAHPTTRTEVTGWDAATLAPMESALATLIGPLARMLVRQAARASTDMDSLAARVGEHIADPAQRQAFVARFAGARGTPGPAQTAATGGTGAPALPPRLVEHATRVLTTHMGPIARIVVKKASARALTRDEFFRLLSEEAGATVDRARLIAELERER
jgi:tRNA A-37 threonylcarbamoyl transferase component Bud32